MIPTPRGRRIRRFIHSAHPVFIRHPVYLPDCLNAGGPMIHAADKGPTLTEITF